MTSPISITSAEAFSFDQRIRRAAVAVTIAGLAVKLFAAAKEFVVAGVFGRSDAMDAFLIAFLIPGLLINLVAESMNQALIPTLVRVQETQGRQKAQELLSSAMAWSCLMLFCGSVFMGLAARFFFPLIVPHFDPAKIHLTELLFYALLPIVILTGIASNCVAVLNTLDRFAWPALTPIVIPLAIMIGSSFLATRYGIWVLVYANLVGALVQSALAVWMMQTYGYSFRLCWGSMTKPLREVAGQYGTILLSGFVASGGLIVDQAMAASLPSGSVATLVYANRFVSVVLTLLAGAVATAVTPYFSQIVAREDWPCCRETLNNCVKITAIISVPLAVTMIFGSQFLVRCVYQHGAFGPKDTAAVAPVQAMYAIQLPFFVVSRIYYRYLVAIRRTSLILACGVMNLVLDVVLNLVLMRWLGVAGIALATSFWTVSTFVFLCYWAYRLLPKKEGSAGD